MTQRQHCVVCAWRENCAKKFCVTDGGARCPDFSRDVSIKSEPDQHQETKKGEQSI
ncbi:hypothetical protein [Geomesophilobacter sediminis]|uniref:Uncharacterized protein n=1 Tax=Geomesophilobacter sediminis TaxID=2798584 RepID=A0A8J7M2G3_9BACT|nr:hypothetical protein [Geomesophilobacter sediminis]MBJ6727523.1 hypothetical protein [Geomesophilobacter sediminis]